MDLFKGTDGKSQWRNGGNIVSGINRSNTGRKREKISEDLVISRTIII